jgi:threonine synthase
MKPPSARFRSLDDHAETYALDEVVYRDKQGGLLEVAHDAAAWNVRAPSYWRALFDSRLGSAEHPYESGVWGKHEWVQPHVAIENVVSLGEGRTPLLPGRSYAKSLGLERLWIKQCGTTHTGSFKDLGMTVLVSSVKQAIANGRPIRAIACASTGDTSAALAAYGAAAEIPVVVLLPAGKVSPAQLLQPLASGALVAALDTDFDGCMRVVQRLTGDPSIYLANSMNSLRVEGQKTLAIELLQQRGWQVPDWVFIPSGNLGNVAAIAKGFLEAKAAGLVETVPRIVACQVEAANPLYLASQRALAAGRPLELADVSDVVAQPTAASAIRIGAPVSAPKAVRALAATNGLVEQANEAELASAVARSDRAGFFHDPHTGVALACMEKLVARGVVKKSDAVVVVSTAHGLKFTELKESIVAGTHPTLGRSHVNEPVRLGADPEEVLAGIHRALDARA